MNDQNSSEESVSQRYITDFLKIGRLISKEVYGKHGRLSGEEIPENVLRFLDHCIDSIEQLRVLLLLHSDPNRTWTTSEMTTALRSAESSISKRLEDLYARNVLVKVPELNGRHQFRASTPKLQKVIDELAHQNQIRPYRIIDAVYSRPNKSLRAFADAFKIRGEKE